MSTPIRRAVLAALGLGLGACAGPAPLPADATTLVVDLQARHVGPRTVSFTQDVVDHREGAAHPTSSMDEWMSVPGHLRIDIAGPPPMTLLFHPEGRTAVTAEGRHDAAEVNAAQVLMLDIFVQQPDVWVGRAAALGIDTRVLSAQTWQDGPAWVLGAEPGQHDRSQLWFDARSGLPVRFLERRQGRDGRVQFSEGRALDYRHFGEVVFHTRFEFLVDGELQITETYRDIVINPPLADGLFDPEVVAQRFVD